MDGIEAILSKYSEFQIVNKVSTKEELFVQLSSSQIDLVILDIFLPKPIGLEILKQLKKEYHKIKVIILSGNDEEDLIYETFKYGASAFLNKGIEEEEFLNAIQIVLSGEQYLSLALEKKVTKNFIKKAVLGDRYSHHKLSSLSQREIEIIVHLSQGLSYKEIANQLDISTRTVEAHKTNILEKLDLKNTIDLVKFAIKNKIIDL